LNRHKATIGVFGIPQDENGRGLWSRRVDGKGINAIGGRIDPQDSEAKKNLFEILQREFLEEAGVEIELVEERPVGVFFTTTLGDIAILLNIRIVSGDPKPTDEAVKHIWLNPDDIAQAAQRYDNGDTADGLLSGKGKRQWRMAKAFFLQVSGNPEFQKASQRM